MKPPRVLVLLAAYNGSSWIAQQIQTILSQTNVDVDLLICDDGSRDDTQSQIALFTRDSRVRVTASKAPTGSAAQNFLQLIRETSAEGYSFVSLADQDDIWHPEKLHRGCARLLESGAAGYSCAVTAFWGDGREAVMSQPAALTESDFLFEGAGQGCSFVMNAAFYGRLRAFLLQHPMETQSVHYHDWAIYALSRAWRLTWVFDARPMMRYRQHETNDTGARVSIQGVKKRLSRIRDGWYSAQLAAIAGLCYAAAPDNPVIAEWHALRTMPLGFLRVYRVARFCLRGGRRRAVDKALLVFSVIAGWV